MGLCLGSALGLAALFSPGELAAAATYIDRTSDVSASYVSTSGNGSDADGATGLAPSDISASFDVGFAWGEAGQAVVLDPTQISVSGSNTAHASEQVTQVQVETEATLELRFSVDEVTAWVLDGSFTGGWDFGGLNPARGSFVITLESLSSGVLLSLSLDSPLPFSWLAHSVTEPLFASGLLQPGEHTLSVFSSQGGNWGSCCTMGGGGVQYDFVLSLPEPSTSALSIVAIFATLSWRLRNRVRSRS